MFYLLWSVLVLFPVRSLYIFSLSYQSPPSAQILLPARHFIKFNKNQNKHRHMKSIYSSDDKVLDQMVFVESESVEKYMFINISYNCCTAGLRKLRARS